MLSRRKLSSSSSWVTDFASFIHIMPYSSSAIHFPSQSLFTSSEQLHVSSPPPPPPHLQAYDELLRSILSSQCNICLNDESTWRQASFPVRDGRIGIRRAVQLAPSAFLASAAGSSDLVYQIFPPHLKDASNPVVESTLTTWLHSHDEPPPSNTASHHQKAWDAPCIRATYDTLLDESSDASTRARLLAVATKESGAWLSALLVSSLGLRIDDNVIRVALRLRLGAPLCEPHHCQHCGDVVNQTGTHGLRCRYSKGRHPRHAAINEVIKRSLGSANIPCHLEPTGLYRSDGKWPDGSLIPWKRGKVLVWDATCPDTLVPSYITLAGAVAEKAEKKKRTKYAHLEESHYFVPVAVETMGVFGPEARSFLRELGHRVANATQDPLSHLYLRQRISVAVQRGNTAAILCPTVGSEYIGDFPSH